MEFEAHHLHDALALRPVSATDQICRALQSAGVEVLRGGLREPGRDRAVPFVRKHVKHDARRFTDLESDLIAREWGRAHQ